MPPRTVTDLAQALPDSERKELLGRIQKSLALQQKNDESIVRNKTPANERKQLIHEGISKLGFVQKFYLWFVKVFANKNEEDAFVDIKMSEISKSIEAGGMVDPVGRTLEPEFAQSLYKLYLAVLPIRGFMNKLWSSENDLREAIQFVIEARVPRSKSKLFQFLPLDEVQMLFEVSESKNSIRQEVLARINNYMDSVPSEIFGEIEQGIMPLYFLRQLCFHDFHNLFRLFYVDSQSLEAGKPEFKASTVDRVLPALENLYYALYTARKAVSLEILPPQLYKYVQTKRLSAVQTEVTKQAGGTEVFTQSSQEAPAPDNLDPAILDEGLKQLRKELKFLQESVAAILDNSHLADVIKFFNNDPYYRFIAYIPSLNLKEFYIATLRYSVLSELDSEFVTIRKMIVKNLYNDLFPKGGAKFEYFQRHPFGEARSGVHGFRFVPSLELLWSFLIRAYVGSTRDTLRGIIKGLPNKNRDTGSELLFHTSGLETCIEKLKALDTSCSPDTEDGKSLQRMKVAMDKDFAQEKQFRIFIIQKDKENREILEEAIEHFSALAVALEEVLTTPAALLIDRYAKNFMHGTPSQFPDFLRSQVVRLKKGSKLIRYQRALDDETF